MSLAPRRNNLAALLTNRAATAGVAFVVQLALIRVLGPSGFGSFTWIMGLIAVATFGNGAATRALLSRRTALAPERALAELPGALWATALAASSSAVLVLCWVAYREPSLLLAAAFATGMSLTQAISQLPRGLFLGLRRMPLEVPGIVSGRLVALVTQLALLAAGFGVTALFGGRLVAAIVATSIATLVLIQKVGVPPIRPTLHATVTHLRRLLPFEATVFFAAVYLELDVVLLKELRGDDEVGLYRAAALFLLQLPTLAQVLSQAVYPRLAKHTAHPQKAGQELAFLLRLMLLIGVPLGTGGVILARPLLHLFAGEAYLQATPVLQVLLLALPLRFVTNGLGQAMSALDQAPRRARINGMAAALNLSLNLAVIPWLGMIGAAYTTVITEILLLVLLLQAVRPHAQGRLFAPMPRILLPAAAMAMLLWALPPLHVLLTVALGAVVYGLLTLWSGAWSPSDRQRLSQL